MWYDVIGAAAAEAGQGVERRERPEKEDIRAGSADRAQDSFLLSGHEDWWPRSSEHVPGLAITSSGRSDPRMGYNF